MNQTAHISLQLLSISKSVETKVTGCALTSLARPASFTLTVPRVSAPFRPSRAPSLHLCVSGEGVLRLVAKTRKTYFQETASFFDFPRFSFIYRVLYQAARMLTHGGFPTHQKSDSMVVYLGGREHGCGD